MALNIVVVETFPVGTTVTAYPKANYTRAELGTGDSPTAAPSAGGGTSLGAVTTGGTVDVSGLAFGHWLLTGTVSAAFKKRDYIYKQSSSTSVPSGGTNGQVLARDASGNAVWIDAPAGTPGASTITSAMIVDGAIVNADINAAAAIAGSKILTGSVAPAVTSVTVSAATTTLDAQSKYDVQHNVTLSATSTTLALSNLVAGASGVIRIIQDATGSRTCALAAAWKAPGGVKPTLSTAANAVDIVSWWTPDGTLVYVQGAVAFA